MGGAPVVARGRERAVLTVATAPLVTADALARSGRRSASRQRGRGGPAGPAASATATPSSHRVEAARGSQPVGAPW